MTETWTPRVLFINPWDKRIGPNRYLIDLLRQDAELAQNSVVVLPEEGEAAIEYRSIGCQVEIWRDAQLVHLKPTLRNLVIITKRHTVGVIHAMSRIRALKVQVVLTNSENVWLGGMAARLSGVPHLQVFHALTLEYNWGVRPWLVKGYLSWLSLWSTRWIAVSHAVEKMLIRHSGYQDRIVVIPNSLNIEEIASAQTSLSDEIKCKIGNRKPVLVSFGRISPIKGHDLLVQALALVKEKFPSLVCLMAGQVLTDEGIDDTQNFFSCLQEQVEKLGLGQNIVFLGEIDAPYTLLKNADVYIQPSRTESFCRAVAEAIICGVPVVAFRVGGVPEVVGENGAILIQPEDTTAMADAVVRLLQEPALRTALVKSGNQHLEKFDTRIIIKDFRRTLEKPFGA
jgi:glycosyltransferase involved in cell wall biosynthesis